MWNPFKNFFKKQNKKNSGNIDNNSSQLGTSNGEFVDNTLDISLADNLPQHDNIPNDKVSDVVDVIENERDSLLQTIDEKILEHILFRGDIDINDVPIEFLRKVASSSTLLDFIHDNIWGVDKVKRVIEGNFRLSDIDYYKEEIFNYDIFSDEDKDLISKLRNDINILDSGYATFSYDEFNNFINSEEYLEDYFEPLIGEEKIFIKT